MPDCWAATSRSIGTPCMPCKWDLRRCRTKPRWPPIGNISTMSALSRQRRSGRRDRVLDARQRPFRNDLVALRRYYWQVGNVVNQAVFFLAATFISDPGKALFAYQLAPLLLMAATFGLLLTYIVRRFLGLSQEAPGATKPLFVALFWILPPLVAIATAPVFLSLSRSFLTETLGFAFMVPGLLLMGHAMQPVPRGNPRCCWRSPRRFCCIWRSERATASALLSCC